MTQIAPSSVTRTIDRSGTEIKAFLDDDNTFIQAMALVDENGNQVATSGSPLYVTITGDTASVVALDDDSITQLTGSVINVGITGTPVFQLNNDSISELTGSVINVGITGTPTFQLDSDSIESITSSLSSTTTTISGNVDLSDSTITNLTSSTSVVEAKLISDTGAQIGLSSSPIWTSITGNADTELVNSVGKLDVASTDMEPLLTDILKELKKLNLYMSLMNDVQIADTDVEV